IAIAAVEPLGNGSRVARSSFEGHDVDAGLAQTPRDQLRRGRAGGTVDDAQPWPQSWPPRGIAMITEPPRGGNATGICNFEALATDALPGDRFRERLRHRSRAIDRVLIEHAVAAVRNPVARLDPGRCPAKRQRRVARCADEIGGAQRPTVDCRNIMRRPGRELGHFSPIAASCFLTRSFAWTDRCDIAQQSGERDVERRERGRQALGGMHDGRMDRIEPEIHTVMAFGCVDAEPQLVAQETNWPNLVGPSGGRPEQAITAKRGRYQDRAIKEET